MRLWENGREREGNMYCHKCGIQLADDSRFCTGCGTPVGVSVGYVPENQGKVGRKKGRGWIIALCVLLVLVLIVGAGGYFLLQGQAGLAVAVMRSARAYSAAEESLALPELGGLVDSRSMYEEMSLEIISLPEAGEFEGMGLRYYSDCDMALRKAGVEIVPFAGEAELLSPVFFISDNELCLSIPELCGEAIYKLDTEKLGEWIYTMDGYAYEELRPLGFNCFELAQMILDARPDNSQALAAYEQLCKSQLERIEISKPVKERLEINDRMLECRVYSVLVPNSVLIEQLNAIRDMSGSADMSAVYGDMLRAMGLSEDMVEDILREINYGMPDTGAVWDEIEKALRDMGNLKVKMAVSKGYLVYVGTSLELPGAVLDVRLELGGGANYVDDLKLSMIDNYGEGLELISTGSHSCIDRSFSDRSSLWFGEEGEMEKILELTSAYDPKAEGENLSVDFWLSDGWGEYEGAITTRLSSGENSMKLSGGNLDFAIDGEKLFELGFDYAVGAYEGKISLDAAAAVDIAAMSQDEIEQAALEILYNTEAWLAEIAGAMGDSFYYIFGFDPSVFLQGPVIEAPASEAPATVI